MESLEMGYDRSEIKTMTNNTSDTIFDGYVNTRRIKKLVSNRRAQRRQIIDEENSRIEELRENIESGIWSLEKLDELEAALKEKKAQLKNNEELKIKDSDVEI